MSDLTIIGSSGGFRAGEALLAVASFYDAYAIITPPTGPPAGYPGFTVPANSGLAFVDPSVQVSEGWNGDGNADAYRRDGKGAFNFSTTNPLEFRVYGTHFYLDARNLTNGTIRARVKRYSDGVEVFNQAFVQSPPDPGANNIDAGLRLLGAFPDGDYMIIISRVSGTVLVDGIGFSRIV